jgi:hypothetical protein
VTFEYREPRASQSGLSSHRRRWFVGAAIVAVAVVIIVGVYWLV